MTYLLLSKKAVSVSLNAYYNLWFPKRSRVIHTGRLTITVGGTKLKPREAIMRSSSIRSIYNSRHAVCLTIQPDRTTLSLARPTTTLGLSVLVVHRPMPAKRTADHSGAYHTRTISGLLLTPSSKNNPSGLTSPLVSNCNQSPVPIGTNPICLHL